jgi:hypothetical protein
MQLKLTVATPNPKWKKEFKPSEKSRRILISVHKVEMPSPTRRNRSRSKSKTRRSRSRSKSASPKTSTGYPLGSMEHDALWNYRIPDLRLRKGIWENFPVVLNKIDDGDGTERYAIRWISDKKRFEDWRKAANSYNMYQDYKDFQIIRLEHAIAAHPRQYILEPARDASMIAVIAMRHK